MRKKLINALKTKFADKGFNQTEIEGLADIFGKNLSEESTDEEIGNAVGGAAEYVEMMEKRRMIEAYGGFRERSGGRLSMKARGFAAL